MMVMYRRRHRCAQRGNAMGKIRSLIALSALLGLASAAPAQRPDPNEEAAIKGLETSVGRSPAWIFAQNRKLDAALSALQPQRPGVVDAYVVAIGLDSDAVFGRESAEASRVLSRRYDAVGRTMLLAAGGGAGADAAANGSPINLAIALGAIAAKMDVKEDVLILFATTHGAPKIGLAYRDGDYGYGMIAPKRLAEMLDGFGFKRRMILLSACFSGEFLPSLADDASIVVTAASALTTSFGCAPSNDWTYFGDALINNALRNPVPFDTAVARAFGLITQWEMFKGMPPSSPQFHFGARSRDWLDPLEARMPKTATAKVGRASIAGN
jgi:hypothetical protein